MLATNAPLLPTEIIHLGLATHGLTALVLLTLIITATILIRRHAPPLTLARYDDKDEFRVVLVIVSSVTLMFATPLFFIATSELLSILIAPRLYILEEMSRLNP
jgi:MFS-type transporter involved in bile tolerance (Atg22 family)